MVPAHGRAIRLLIIVRYIDIWLQKMFARSALCSSCIRTSNLRCDDIGFRAHMWWRRMSYWHYVELLRHYSIIFRFKMFANRERISVSILSWRAFDFFFSRHLSILLGRFRVEDRKILHLSRYYQSWGMSLLKTMKLPAQGLPIGPAMPYAKHKESFEQTVVIWEDGDDISK